MNTSPIDAGLLDRGLAVDSFEKDVLDGLIGRPKTLPSKYFYDERGSRLFDQICELEEYYLTRTEIDIMRRHCAAIVDHLGPGCMLVEYGSGSSLKTNILLDGLVDPAGYVPIDISRDHLKATVVRLRATYPDLEIHPVCADYTRPFQLPTTDRNPRRTVIYFPGSTIGNFEPEDARHFLRRMASVSGEGGALLIGVDLQKDRNVLEAAYNDAQGITEAFNKNLLVRINRELGADFDPEAFRHDAIYNVAAGRIEMYLISRSVQHVGIAGHCIHFRRDERICTEHSYKYTSDGFADLASSSGFRVEQVWTDPKKWFSVQYCTVERA